MSALPIADGSTSTTSIPTNATRLASVRHAQSSSVALIPPGSVLGRWRRAAADPARRDEGAKLARQAETLLSGPRPVKKGPDSALFDRLVARFGGVDALVNNAGTCFMSDFPDIPAQELDRQMAINFSSAFHCCQGAVKAMAGSSGWRCRTMRIKS